MQLCYSNVTSQYSIWSLCYDIMPSHLTILLLRSADLSLYLGDRLLHFAILLLYSCILPFRHWEKPFCCCDLSFSLRVSLWCFVKVTCSSALHSETSFGQDRLFPANVIIMLINFLSVALSWLETWRLFVKERCIFN